MTLEEYYAEQNGLTLLEARGWLSILRCCYDNASALKAFARNRMLTLTNEMASLPDGETQRLLHLRGRITEAIALPSMIADHLSAYQATQEQWQQEAE